MVGILTSAFLLLVAPRRAAGADSERGGGRSLAAWRFSDGSFAGDQGQLPLTNNNVTIVANGFQGPGVQFGAGKAALKYRAVEASGQTNLSPVRGSVLFRIRPSWSTVGGGPGAWSTIIESSNFALRVSPNGKALVLTSVRDRTTVTNVELSVVVRRNLWSYGLLTYSPEESSLSFDGPSIRAVGSGVQPPERFNPEEAFFAIGSAANGSGAINATMDEIVTFNAPGAIGVTPPSISAVPSDNPPGLNLLWRSATNAITEVKRRALGGRGWDSTRTAFGTNFMDTSVVPGERYEYNINTRIADVKTGLPDDAGRSLKAARAGEPMHERGKLILLVDRTLAGPLEPELSGFITNLVGDGWQILRTDVPRHVDDYSAPSKFLTNYYNMTNAILPFIRSNYAHFGSEIKYILALGHVPVPYTGTAADDGHTAPHVGHGAHNGAWPSDVFYGDVDGLWTDIQTATNSSYSFNWNIPGDGKMDQNKLPANRTGQAAIEIPVARIDLAYMPLFKLSEVALLKRYFEKNAAFRKSSLRFPPEAITAEYILRDQTLAGEMASEMISKVAPVKVPVTGDLFTDRRSFLVGVQSGAGVFDRINDSLPGYEHTSAEIANGVPGGNCAFVFLRGSYFCDWNTQNNFLRSILTLPNGGLTVAGFFQKAWSMEGLGVGQTIGQCMSEVINSWPSYGFSIRSMEILGDPTLRYPVLAPPGTPQWRAGGDRSIILGWSAAPDATAYYVYRSAGEEGFKRITPSAISGTSYTDSDVPKGRVTYMIRAAGLQTTGEGSFTNLSQGAFSAAINADNL